MSDDATTNMEDANYVEEHGEFADKCQVIVTLGKEDWGVSEGEEGTLRLIADDQGNVHYWFIPEGGDELLCEVHPGELERIDG